MNRLAVVPATFEMGSHENLPLYFDCSALLADGESIANIVVSLTDLASGAAYDEGRNGSPGVVAPSYIVQRIWSLVAGHTYRLEVSFDPWINKTWQMELIIECPL